MLNCVLFGFQKFTEHVIIFHDFTLSAIASDFQV